MSATVLPLVSHQGRVLDHGIAFNGGRPLVQPALSLPDTHSGCVGRLTRTAPGPQPSVRSGGGQPRVLVDQPVHSRAADHWTSATARSKVGARGGRSSRLRWGRYPL